jgi:hypothetical protein
VVTRQPHYFTEGLQVNREQVLGAERGCSGCAAWRCTPRAALERVTVVWVMPSFRLAPDS